MIRGVHTSQWTLTEPCSSHVAALLAVATRVIIRVVDPAFALRRAALAVAVKGEVLPKVSLSPAPLVLPALVPTHCKWSRCVASFPS